MTKSKKYTCPCCGYRVFEEEPGSFGICPICYWEDELKQLRYPKEKGANKVSLVEAQLNYEEHGASDLDLKIFVRKPNGNDEKDEKWRKIDLKKDKIAEKKEGGMDSVNIYPIETTRLYYWEENYLAEE
jgi:uncharacterized Zn finger protein (UPF0148 family)